MIDRKNDREHVAWDIETTGFGVDGSLTVVGFWFPGGHAVLLLNVYSEEWADADKLESQIDDVTEGIDVTVRVCEGGGEMLQGIREVMYERFEKNQNRLVAYNAESWNGGFDLPFLRTRCIACSVPWVFDGLQFADLYDPLKKCLNTTFTDYSTSADANTLTGSHELLTPTKSLREPLRDRVSEDHSWYVRQRYDPFESSANAVYAYRKQFYLDVLLHNLADIHRTWELGELLRTYAPGKDISTKKL